MLNDWLPKGSLRRIVAGNTLSQLVGRAVSSVSIVIVSLLIAGRFGPEGYGDFVKITTYVGFFYLFADFGLNAVYLQRTTRVSSAMSSDAAADWRLLFGLRCVVSVALVVVSLILLSFFPSGIGQGYTALVRFGIMVLAPVIIAQAMTTTTNAFFQKSLRYDLSTLAQNIGSVTMLGAAVALSFLSPLSGPMMGVASVFLGSIVTAFAALVLVRSRLGRIAPKFSVTDMQSYLRAGAPLGLALVFNLIYFHSDSVVLALTRSTREVGIYGLAYKVFELPLVIPIFFMNSVYPLLLQTNRDADDQRHMFLRSLNFLLISAVVSGSALWVVSPFVTLIRPDFAPSVEPLRILLLGLPIFFVSALYMWFIIAHKKQTVLLVIHGVAMTGNIISNMLFIPAYGYIAASWITIGSEIFVLGASVWFVRSSRMFHKGGVA